MINLLITGSSQLSVFTSLARTAVTALMLSPQSADHVSGYLDIEDNKGLSPTRDILIWKGNIWELDDWKLRGPPAFVYQFDDKNWHFWINILFDRSNEKEHEHFTGHSKDTILRYVSQHLLLTLWIYNIIDF